MTDEPEQSEQASSKEAEAEEDTMAIEYEPGEKRPLNHGTKIRAKIKRGEGTRDQDELLIEGRGEDAAEAAKDFEDALNRAEENNWTDRLRNLQVDAPDDQPDHDGVSP